jgi:hypothetical protein
LHIWIPLFWYIPSFFVNAPFLFFRVYFGVRLVHENWGTMKHNFWILKCWDGFVQGSIFIPYTLLLVCVSELFYTLLSITQSSIVNYRFCRLTSLEGKWWKNSYPTHWTKCRLQLRLLFDAFLVLIWVLYLSFSVLLMFSFRNSTLFVVGVLILCCSFVIFTCNSCFFFLHVLLF